MIGRLHRVAWLAAFLVGCGPAAGSVASSHPPAPGTPPLPTSTPVASPTPPASYVQVAQRQELSLPQPREELASAALDGLTGGSLDLNVTLTQLGQPQTITTGPPVSMPNWHRFMWAAD